MMMRMMMIEKILGLEILFLRDLFLLLEVHVVRVEEVVAVVTAGEKTRE